MKKKLAIAALCMVLLFIWCNSMLPSGMSNSISEAVRAMLGRHTAEIPETIHQMLPDGILTIKHVRKFAHLLEFFSLGVLCALAFLENGKPVSRNLGWAMFVGLLAGVLDETIQLFNDRTSQVKDVWIDFLGFCIGVGLLCLVRAICRHYKLKKQKKGDA
ncbi:MAG: VanZ family protein [Oscillospiraceae bacterium]|nr:VanZ family protein [Oscillospiraceae bacterium]